ncbi:hypothetical protein C8R44DRAFT_805761 [Mycena epipterygia]|nr:hypothetical protein C8R44DRAFT_805761 [Mycena epipterygia]
MSDGARRRRVSVFLFPLLSSILPPSRLSALSFLPFGVPSSACSPFLPFPHSVSSVLFPRLSSSLVLPFMALLPRNFSLRREGSPPLFGGDPPTFCTSTT